MSPALQRLKKRQNAESTDHAIEHAVLKYRAHELEL